MGSLKLNLADIPSNNLTVGDHPALIRTVTHAIAADNENYNLVWESEVIDGVDAGKTGKMWTSLKKTALWRLVDTLKVIGVLPEDAVEGDLDIEWDDETGIVYQPELTDLPVTLRVTYDAKAKRSNIEIVSANPTPVSPASKGSGSKPRLR